jgi:hypothetical protein
LSVILIEKKIVEFFRAWFINIIMKLYFYRINMVLILCGFFVPMNILKSQQLAFPGAEGAGKFTIGGRGGEVYEVTNLNDNGPGSLRDAILKSGPRTIIFRISGNIRLKSPLKITKPYLTIAGQTAPGDGICICDENFSVQANNVIIRYIRVRMGDLDTLNEDDAFSGWNCKNVIIDHCSVSWSIDEAMSIYRGIDSLTVQWCFVTESLRYSHHSKGAHGYGGIWGGINASWHHNLLAHHSSRTPRWDRGENVQNVDERNNVIYNWTFNSCYGGEASTTLPVVPSTINMVANYYKSGPSTQSAALKYRIANPSFNENGWGQWFIDQNYVYGYIFVTTNNWTYGVQGITDEIKSQIRVDQPFPFIPIDQQSPEEAYKLVLAQGGDNFPKRDTIDKRIVWEVKNDTALYGGKTGAHSGIIDSQIDVGGWPELYSTEPPVDTDHDGMPDFWENTNGLNYNDPSDRNKIAANGYTYLEIYLNSLVSNVTNSVKNNFTFSKTFFLYQNYPNPFNPTTKIKYTIPFAGTSSKTFVKLKIYDLLGKEVATLVNKEENAGSYEVEFSAGSYGSGLEIASGIYIAQITAGTMNKSIKILLMK